MLRFELTPRGLATGLRYSDLLGFLPMFLDERDPRSAREQIDANYAHGGGWHPLAGFKMLDDNSIQYPDDPPYEVLATATLRDEKLYFYNHEWLAVVQPDGSFEVNRMD